MSVRNAILFLLISIAFVFTHRIYAQQQVGVTHIKASSTLVDVEGAHRHGAEKAFDGDPSTVWAEGSGHGGISEYLEIAFDREITIDGIEVTAGYFVKAEFEKYNRVKLLLAAGGGQQIPLRLKDQMAPQFISIDPVTFQKMKFEIQETYQIAESDVTVIAEIAFYRNGRKINLVQVEPMTTSAPIITDVKLREHTSSGVLIIYQDIYFYDLDGDTYYVNYELVSTTGKSVRVVSSTIRISSEQQKAGTVITGKWTCEGTFTTTLRVTLLDSAGNRSNPVEYTMNCR